MSYWCRRGYTWLAMYVQLIASLRRTGRTFVISRHVGAHRLTPGAKVAVFAHFDDAGVVHDFVIHYLQALRDAGYVIVFVSNSPDIDTASLHRVLQRSALVLLRTNIGYDFGAFRDGIEALGELDQFAEVVLTNDSVYGPLFNLRDVLARCDASADVWGMTDNWAHVYHLQSYFLLFRKSALVCQSLRAFFRAVRPVQSKEWIIRKYEIRFTRAMQRAGLRCSALFPYQTVAAAFSDSVEAGHLTWRSDLSLRQQQYFTEVMRQLRRGEPLNATHSFWGELIGKMQFPFIKRELLMHNPMRVPQVCQWQEVVRDVSDYDTNLISRHMQSQQRSDRTRMRTR